MTTLAPNLPVVTPSVRAGHLRPAGVLRSEWTKLRSVRSTTWTLFATVVLTIGIGVLATATEASRWAHASALDKLTFDPTNLSLTGLFLGQLAIGVLGVLAISAEYGSGTIRATLAAVPNRKLMLGAKTAIFGAVALVVGEVVSFGAFLVGQAILTGSTPHAALGDPGVLRAVVGGGLFLAVLGLLGLGLGTIIRHTAGAITAFVGLVLVLPLIVQALPTSISHAVGKFLPANIGNAMTTVVPGGRVGSMPLLSPWVGFGLLCAYAAIALVVGGIMLTRRDA
jgi:ABC-2 type transport system permease protein